MAGTIGPDDAGRFAPGTHGCHEALHMASVLAELVETQLAEHPAVRQNPDWQALADRAVEALADLYQAIGTLHGEAPDGRSAAAAPHAGADQQGQAG